jgi:hypothetical protein
VPELWTLDGQSVSMIIRTLFVAVLMATLSCHADDWHHSTWKFDRDSTIAGLRTNTIPSAPPPTAPGVPDWASPHPFLVIGQLDGVCYSFTATNVVITSKAGTQVKPYTIVKRLSSSEAIIQIAGSETNSVRVVSGHLEIDANLGFKLFFSRVTK